MTTTSPSRAPIALMVSLALAACACEEAGTRVASPKEIVQLMDEREFLSLLHAVEHDRGDPYVEARDRLVREGKRARPLLEQQLDDPDPNRVQAAQVVLGWMDHPEEYRLVSDYLLRRADPPGSPPPRMGARQHAIRAVQGMQPLVVPRLIELLLKTDEIRFREPAWDLLKGSILFERRFAEPFATIMLDASRPMLERLFFADDLRDNYADPRCRSFAHEVAWDESVSAEHRGYAFGMLADEQRTEELPAIRAALQDPVTNEEALQALTTAVAEYRDQASVDTLLRILRRAETPALRIEVLGALGTLGAWRTMSEVERVASSDPDAAVRSRARSTLVDLRGARMEAELR